MAMRWLSGTCKISRVRSMASFRRALPSLERCDRPSTAISRFEADQPGRLAQGPEEKYGRAGRTGGGELVMLFSPYRERAPRWDGVARGRF